MTTDEISLNVEGAEVGMRLDRFLAVRFAARGLSRSRLAAAVEDDLVTVAGRPTVKAHRLKAGEVIVVDTEVLEEPAPVDPLKPREHPDLELLHLDGDVVVVDKPAGLVVHPGRGHPDDTLLNALAARSVSLAVVGDPERPGVVHRLDKDTSGVLVLARTRKAHLGLTKQFAAHSARRVYQALCHGVPEPAAGTIDAPLARHRRDRKRFAVVEGGRRAVTHYTVLEALGGAGFPAALLECRLETGRTHQIRAHLTHRSHPLLGDPVYATRSSRAASRALPLTGQALHARLLGFTHPVSGEVLTFTSEPPAAFADSLGILRGA